MRAYLHEIGVTFARIMPLETAASESHFNDRRHPRARNRPDFDD